MCTESVYYLILCEIYYFFANTELRFVFEMSVQMVCLIEIWHKTVLARESFSFLLLWRAICQR